MRDTSTESWNIPFFNRKILGTVMVPNGTQKWIWNKNISFFWLISLRCTQYKIGQHVLPKLCKHFEDKNMTFSAFDHRVERIYSISIRNLTSKRKVNILKFWLFFSYGEQKSSQNAWKSWKNIKIQKDVKIDLR